MKKKFIIINGKEVQIIERINLDAAKQTAINICDHSKEIIVRQIENITDYSIEYINE